MTGVKLPTYETLLIEAVKSLTVDAGILTSPIAIGGNTVVDAAKNWGTNIHRNRLVRVKSRETSLQASIQANAPTVLTINGIWTEAVAAGSVYVILGLDVAQVLRDVFFGGGLGVDFAPIEQAAEHNTAELAAVNILAANLAPTNPPCLFRVSAAFDAAGILSVQTTRAGNAQLTLLNGGVPLNNNSLYMFDHLVHVGDTINYQYSVNATLMVLRVQEIGVGTQ